MAKVSKVPKALRGSEFTPSSLRIMLTPASSAMSVDDEEWALTPPRRGYALPIISHNYMRQAYNYNL